MLDLTQDPLVSILGTNTWNSIGYVYDNPQTARDKIHTDQHTMAVNPGNPNDILVGNDGGIYHLSYSPSTGVSTFNSLNANLGTTRFHNIALHPTDPNQLIGGAQDNGSPRSNGDINNWNILTDSDGGACAIDPTNTNVQYTTTQWLGSQTPTGTVDGILRTTDGWQSYGTIKPLPFQDPNVAATAPMLLDPNNHNLLYTASNTLLQWNATTSSWNMGNQVLASNQPGPDYGYVLSIAIAPTDSNRIYTGSNHGELWMSTNAGASGSWTQLPLTAGVMPNAAITSISVSPTNPSSILIGFSGSSVSHLWRCDNTAAGAPLGWNNVSGGGATALPPGIPINAIARTPGGTAVSDWFVGADIGVFHTSDAGSTWQNATQPLGLPNVQVNDLQVVPGTSYLNAATYGRGIWRIDLGQFQSHLVAQSSSAQQVAFWYTQAANVTGGAYALLGPGPINLPPNWQVVATGDFNADGSTDLVLDNTSTGQIGFWFMSANNVTSGVFATMNGVAIGVPSGFQIVGSGDFNNDGKPDLVLANTTTGQVTVWIMNGTVVASGSYITSGGSSYPLPAGWQVVGVGDFNGDGHPDLVLDNPGSAQIAIWIITGYSVAIGDYVTTKGNLALLPSGWQIAAVGNFNGDNTPDLVLQNLSNRELAFWYTVGTTISSTSYTLSGGGLYTMPTGWQVNGPR